MIDSTARHYVEPIISWTAKKFHKGGLNPNHVTWFAFLIGSSSGVLIYKNNFWWAIVVLWISGFLDAVDGSMARQNEQTTAWGTLLDITFDRIVEISYIIGLALCFPASRLYLIFMCGSIILSMTIFLSVGTLSRKKGKKTFYYQAGLVERTEGFILFSLMLIFVEHVSLLAIIYTGAVLVTALQRMLEARKILGN